MASADPEAGVVTALEQARDRPARINVQAPSWAPPAAALEEWERLRDALDLVTRPVPCTAAPDDWFTTSREAAAVAGCQVCPVLHLCASYAMAAGSVEGAGVWGALTESARLELRRAEAAS